MINTIKPVKSTYCASNYLFLVPDDVYYVKSCIMHKYAKSRAGYGLARFLNYTNIFCIISNGERYGC